MLAFKYQDGVSNQQEKTAQAFRPFYGHSQEQLDREVKSREAWLFGNTQDTVGEHRHAIYIYILQLYTVYILCVT